MQSVCPLRTGRAFGCSHRLKSSPCSPSPFLFIYFHKWFSIHGTAPVSKTKQTDAEPCAGCVVGSTHIPCGFGAGEVKWMPLCPFIPVSSCPWDAWCLCTPNKQSHMYLHTSGFVRDCCTWAVPRPTSGYPLCSMGTLGLSDGRNLGFGRCLMAGSGCRTEKSHFVSLAKWCPDWRHGTETGAGDEVLFYQPDLYEEHLGITQLRDTRL